MFEAMRVLSLVRSYRHNRSFLVLALVLFSSGVRAELVTAEFSVGTGAKDSLFEKVATLLQQTPYLEKSKEIEERPIEVILEENRIKLSRFVNPNRYSSEKGSLESLEILRVAGAEILRIEMEVSEPYAGKAASYGEQEVYVMTTGGPLKAFLMALAYDQLSDASKAEGAEAAVTTLLEKPLEGQKLFVLVGGVFNFGGLSYLGTGLVLSVGRDTNFAIHLRRPKPAELLVR